MTCWTTCGTRHTPETGSALKSRTASTLTGWWGSSCTASHSGRTSHPLRKTWQHLCSASGALRTVTGQTMVLHQFKRLLRSHPPNLRARTETARPRVKLKESCPVPVCSVSVETTCQEERTMLKHFTVTVYSQAAEPQHSPFAQNTTQSSPFAQNIQQSSKFSKSPQQKSPFALGHQQYNIGAEMSFGGWKRMRSPDEGEGQENQGSKRQRHVDGV